MSEQKKSMDDVLASIRKIIKTDPNAAPPDASTLPPIMDSSDDTAKSVLDKLRKEKAADDGPARPLSGTTDDPEETANAILERLRQEAEAEAKAAPKEAKKAEPEPEEAKKAEPEPEDEAPGKGSAKKAAKAAEEPEEPADDAPAAKKAKKSDPEPEPEPVLAETPEEPPAVGSDEDGVPDLDDEEPLELGADTGARVLEPEDDEPDAEPQTGRDAGLPQPAKPAPAPEPVQETAELPIMLDEAVLEDTVRRIVRDELTGDMGRRMTKNVQRMIETEVKRLLAERGED